MTINSESKLEDKEVIFFIESMVQAMTDSYAGKILNQPNFITSDQLIVDINISILASFLSFILYGIDSYYKEKSDSSCDFGKKELMLDDIYNAIKKLWKKLN